MDSNISFLSFRSSRHFTDLSSFFQKENVRFVSPPSLQSQNSSPPPFSLLCKCPALSLASLLLSTTQVYILSWKFPSLPWLSPDEHPVYRGVVSPHNWKPHSSYPSALYGFVFSQWHLQCLAWRKHSRIAVEYDNKASASLAPHPHQ